MPYGLALSAKWRQAPFANRPLGQLYELAANGGMENADTRRRRTGSPMPYLRAWRESVGLSRQKVVDRMAVLCERPVMDQAALAKWETGETAVRVEDLELLAKVYGVSTDRLFFAPGDHRTPELLRRAHEIIVRSDPEAIERWLGMGDILPEQKTKQT